MCLLCWLMLKIKMRFISFLIICCVLMWLFIFLIMFFMLMWIKRWWCWLVSRCVIIWEFICWWMCGLSCLFWKCRSWRLIVFVFVYGWRWKVVSNLLMVWFDKCVLLGILLFVLFDCVMLESVLWMMFFIVCRWKFVKCWCCFWKFVIWWSYLIGNMLLMMLVWLFIKVRFLFCWVC